MRSFTGSSLKTCEDGMAAGKRVLICFSAMEVEQDCVCGFF